MSIPFVGPGAADLVFGGEFPAGGMLGRLWWLHVIILPVLIGGLLAAHLALVFLQTHTQFGSETKQQHNVVGASAWPGYALKTVGLSLIVFATLFGLGAVIEIAPVWLYGPFEPDHVTVPAQPDWYLGWVEGALRISPPIDIELFGREIPSQSIAGVLMPLLFFAVLYTWPMLEEMATGDRAEHHLVERPRDHPVRSACGAAGLAFLVVLTAAGSHDLQALLIEVPVEQVTIVYRAAFVLVPPLAGIVTWKMCRDLARQSAERPA